MAFGVGSWGVSRVKMNDSLGRRVVEGNAIFSMTGFGSGVGEIEGVRALVEIRSVNYRGLKFHLRSIPSLGTLEKNVRDILGEVFQRGAIDVTVFVTRVVDPEHCPIQENIARSAIAALRHLAAELGLHGDLSARDLLLIPGLFENIADLPVTPKEWPAVETALRIALEQTLAMRRAEGMAMAVRLRELIRPVEDFAREARRIAPKVVERTRERLRERLLEWNAVAHEAAQAAIEREICLFADRVDINEELDRLSSHLAQFYGLLQNGGDLGRRLEFLGQELLREINTCASKANDGEIIALAMEAKLAVEKIKEQSANLE